MPSLGTSRNASLRIGWLLLSLVVLTAALQSCLTTMVAPPDRSLKSKYKLPAGKKLLKPEDFEGGPSPTGTSWESKASGNNTEAEPVPFEVSSCGAETPTHCARLTGKVGRPEPPWPEAGISLNMSRDYKAIDLTGLHSIRFWVKGDGKTYRLQVARTATNNDWAHYEHQFRAPSKWSQVQVRMSELVRPTWSTKPVSPGFDDVYKISFGPAFSDDSFDFSIDDIELVVDADAPFPLQEVRSVPVLPEAELAQLDAEYTPVSIESVANRSFKDEVADDEKGGWTDAGKNSVYGFPTGEQRFRGIPFVTATKGRQVLVLGGENSRLPNSATIPVGKSARALYFLHSSAWTAPENGSYVVVYQDDVRETIAVRGGVEVFDFWKPSNSPVARTAWEGKNPVQDPIGLTLLAWENPRPNIPIKEIVAVRPENDQAFLILAGITLADKGPFLPELETIRLDADNWIPFDGIVLAKRKGTALDPSRYWHRPAGKFGPVQAVGDSFAFANGKKVRFWGTTTTSAPPKALAAEAAEFYSLLGINMSRHHGMDAPWNNDPNIFGPDPITDDPKKNSRNIDSDYLDRFDFLVSELQKRGIYQTLDLNSLRSAYPADGIKDAKAIRGYRIAGLFDEKMIQLQEEYATKLLTHKNPYTGKRYADDPALAMILIINESSLAYLGFWDFGELNSEHYWNELSELYNDWLRSKFKTRQAIEARWALDSGEAKDRIVVAADEDPANGTVRPIRDFSDRTADFKRYSLGRQQDNLQFLHELEVRYFKRMEAAVRKAGYRGLVAGTNHWLDRPIDIKSNIDLDYIARNEYWAQPASGYTYDRGTVHHLEKSMLREPNFGLVGDQAEHRVVGLPFLTTEFNSLPLRYRADAPVLMAAYGGLHGWSTLQYAMSSPFERKAARKARLSGVYDITYSPLDIATRPATAAMVLRDDVTESPVTYEKRYGAEELVNPETEVSLPDGLPLIAKTGITFSDGPPGVTPNDVQSLLARQTRDGFITSITGELMADPKRGLFKLDTPRSQALVGFLGKERIGVSALAVTIRNKYAVVLATSLDGAPLVRSKNVLFTAVGNQANSGMEVFPSGEIVAPGRRPIRVEPIVGEVELQSAVKPGAVTVYALNFSGERTSKVPVTVSGNSIKFELAARHQAVAYELVRK